MGKRKIEPTAERFLRLAIPEPNSGCWLWAGFCDKFGYSYIHCDSLDRLVRVSRWVLGISNVVYTPDLVACHKCDNPNCVNPQHLFKGTQKENGEDSSRKGRVYKGGANNPHGKGITHCIYGHEFTPENTIFWGSKKKRYCRACQAKRYAVARKSNRGLGICSKGHQVSGENMRIYSGKKRCLRCCKERWAKNQAIRQLSEPTQPAEGAGDGNV